MTVVVATVMVVSLCLCGWCKHTEHHNQREHRKHSAFQFHKLSSI